MKLNKKVIVRTALCAVLVSALGYSFVAKSETKLIPFQGKLTDASGQVISDGAIVVQFKMYDAPVGGQAKWNGEVQMLSVNGGLVNTTLGTKASLKNVDFSSPTYLEITIDANGDNQIGPEDPPLLPRQSIIPAVYAVKAGDAKTLSGYDWSAVFSDGNPETGTINGAKLTSKSVSTAQIANNAVTANQIRAGAVTFDKLDKSLANMIQVATPPGTIIAFGGENVPDGWLKCDGRPLSSKDYPALYQAISTNWGAGCGWSIESNRFVKLEGCDFNLPELRGVFLRGWNNGFNGKRSDPDVTSRSTYIDGGATGDHVGSYQDDSFKNHVHKMDDYTYSWKNGVSFGDNVSYGWIECDHPSGAKAANDFVHDTRWSGDNETRPKNAYVNYIIKY